MLSRSLCQTCLVLIKNLVCVVEWHDTTKHAHMMNGHWRAYDVQVLIFLITNDEERQNKSCTVSSLTGEQPGLRFHEKKVLR